MTMLKLLGKSAGGLVLFIVRVLNDIVFIGGGD